MKEILLIVGPAALALLVIAILVTWLIVKTRSLNALRESEARAHERSLELLKAANEAALQQQISAIRAEMTAETERLLQQREEALSRKAQETFQTISGSLDKEMKGMKEAFEAQKKSTNESSASLKEQLEGAVRNLAAQTRDIGQKADNLASALKGQNKMAGCWGETILYNMLVDEGMVEGRDFDKEETLRDAMGLVILNEDSGKKMRPDFILHYPDRTEVIIDSKVSLDAYSDWSAAESEALRNDAAVRNLTAIRTQVKSLATKRYQDYIREGYKTLDYVIMFIHSQLRRLTAGENPRPGHFPRSLQPGGAAHHGRDADALPPHDPHRLDELRPGPEPGKDRESRAGDDRPRGRLRRGARGDGQETGGGNEGIRGLLGQDPGIRPEHPGVGAPARQAGDPEESEEAAS